MKRLYLCGAINGCTDAQCKDWREAVKTQLAGLYEFVDPMRRDYRGKEDESVKEIVTGDYDDIHGCDVILVAASVPSWGTAMEMHHAFLNEGRTVVAFCEASRVSPWLRYHSTHLFRAFGEAVEYLRKTA